MNQKPPTTSPLVLSYEGDHPDEELLGWVREGVVAGIVLFKANATSEDAIKSAVEQLRASCPTRLSIMIDEEGGRVRRLPDAPESMPALRTYGSGSLETVAAAYKAVAERLRRLDIDMLLAPVIDVGGEDTDWLDDRTFADDPDRVAAFARAVIPAIQGTGVAACAKHFPGLHSVAIDPHTERAIERTPPSQWDQLDAVPFRAAITSHVGAVMVGHQIMMGFDPEHPACLSSMMVGMLLRQRLGYTGLVLTDDMAMGAIAKYYRMDRAVSLALRAGCNRVLICQNRDLQRQAVEGWRAQTKPT